MLTKLLLIVALILGYGAYPSYAQDIGYWNALDCSSLGPVNDETVCHQKTDTTGSGGRLPGLYRYASGVWGPVGAGGPGGGAPTTVDYIVCTGDATLSAERIPTDTPTIDFDCGTAGQLKAAIVANSIGPTQVDETANYNFTGTLLTPTVVASLGTATLNVFKAVTDAVGNCTVGGGSTFRLCRGNGTTWDTVGDYPGTSTWDAVMDVNPKTTGRTCSSPVEVEGNTSGTLYRICDDPTIGIMAEPVIGGVLGAANKRTTVNSGFDWCVNQRSGGVCQLTVDYTNGVTKADGLVGGFTIPVATGVTLLDTDDFNNVLRIPFGMQITQVCAQTDAGTSVINLQRNDGSAANILTANLTGATTEACTTAFVAGEDILSEGHYINFVMVTGAASGAPTKLTVSVKTKRKA